MRGSVEAAKAIQAVRKSYGDDISRIENSAPDSPSLPLYRAIYRELDRAAKLAETGIDPGDAGSAPNLDGIDPYCREENCRYRHWASGSVPTHRRGAHCPPVTVIGQANS